MYFSKVIRLFFLSNVPMPNVLTIPMPKRANLIVETICTFRSSFSFSRVNFFRAVVVVVVVVVVVIIVAVVSAVAIAVAVAVVVAVVVVVVAVVVTVVVVVAVVVVVVSVAIS